MVQWTAMDFKGSWTPYWKVLRLVWPLALGMANNALMQFTDRVFLARESAASLEAILPASMLAFTFVCFFQSIAAYSGTFVAQYHGAGNPRGAAASCRAGLLLSLAAGIVLALLIPLGRIICDWCGHPPDVLAREKTYYTIVMSGGFFLCAAMAVQSFFTGIGRTRLVFWVNLLGNEVKNFAVLLLGKGRSLACCTASDNSVRTVSYMKFKQFLKSRVVNGQI